MPMTPDAKLYASRRCSGRGRARIRRHRALRRHARDGLRRRVQAAARSVPGRRGIPRRGRQRPRRERDVTKLIALTRRGRRRCVAASTHFPSWRNALCRMNLKITVDEQDDEADATELDDPEPEGPATGAEARRPQPAAPASPMTTTITRIRRRTRTCCGASRTTSRAAR